MRIGSLRYAAAARASSHACDDPRLRRAMTRRRPNGDDRAVQARGSLRPLAGGAAVGIVGQLLHFDQLPGVNVALLAVCALLVLARTEPRWSPLRDDAWMAAALIALAAACAIRADPALVWLDLAAVTALALALVAARAGVRVMDLSLLRSALEALAVSVNVAWAGWTLVRDERARVRAGGAATFGGLGPYAGGAVLATPFLGIFVVLFAGADAVFARWLEESFDDIRDVPGRAVLALVIAWLAAGALSYRMHRSREVAEPRPAILGIEPAGAMLLLIDALFLVFVSLQIAYLFGGRDTLEAARMPYSEYARRGFFELIAVGGIVAALVVGLEVVLRSRTRTYVALLLGLLGLTAVVLASAAFRLDLYQQGYGWTEQRFYAAATLGFLGVSLAILAWGVARDRVLFIGRPLAIAAVLGILAINAVGPSAFIARANTDRALDPLRVPADASRDLDVRYLISLGDGAIPTLIERASSLPDEERTAVVGLLNGIAWRSARERPYGWQSWNVERERSRSALLVLGSGTTAGRMNLR
jgi:hypothetical protein